ncbi:unnamed protein product [Mytilus coruscus]|uniref:Uncharacterized protein n=1 Tax=Mytilus coruscus TaxID=42192 RepID=A0A6J8CI26_MYTCO|nr:unnamed protein product [Mytilus coruscus]
MTNKKKKRERLSPVVAGGIVNNIWVKLQLSDIDKMTPEQIDKLYCKYEARLGASMTKTLGNSFINLYGMFLAPFTTILTTAKHIEPLASIDFKNKDENNDIKMMNENPEQEEKKKKERSDRSPFKNPNQKTQKSSSWESLVALIKWQVLLAMMLGGAITNAFAFSGSNYLFSHMGSNANEEKIRHDKAIEKLEKAQADWNKRRIQRLDFINEQLQKEHHAEHTFEDVDQAMKQYYYITSKQLTPLSPKPKLSDFYTPSEDQKNREIAFVVGGMVLTGFVVWKLK